MLAFWGDNKALAAKKSGRLHNSVSNAIEQSVILTEQSLWHCNSNIAAKFKWNTLIQ